MTCLQDTFSVAEESKHLVLKSAGAKWRQFKANLNSDYVKPYIGQKKKLRKPPKQYAFVGKEAWQRFVAERTTEKWMVCIIYTNLYLHYFNTSESCFWQKLIINNIYFFGCSHLVKNKEIE